MNLTIKLPRISKTAKKEPSPERHALGHLLTGEDGTWALYTLPAVEWSALDDSGRERQIDAYAAMIGQLVDRKYATMEWCVPDPFPAQAYADAMILAHPNAPEGFDAYVEASANAILHHDVHRAAIAVRFTTNKLDSLHELPVASGRMACPMNMMILAEYAREVSDIDNIMCSYGAEPMTEGLILGLSRQVETFGLPSGAHQVEAATAPYQPATEIHALTEDGGAAESHTQVLRLNAIKAHDDAGQWPHMAWAQTLPYQVAVVRRTELIKAEDLAESAMLRARRSFWTNAADTENGGIARGEVEEAMVRGKEVRDEIANGADRAMSRTLYMVAAPTADAVAKLGRKLTVAAAASPQAGGIGVELSHEFGQFADYRMFQPGRAWTPIKPEGGHVSRSSVTVHAAGLPSASQSAGDQAGLVLGPIAESGDVYIHDPFATDRPQRPRLHAVVGEPGSGKSTLFGLAINHLVMSGIRCTVNDPSGQLARLAALHPGRARVVQATAGGMAGSLMPHRLVPEPRRADYDTAEEFESAVRERAAERVALAVDMTTEFVPWKIREHDTGRIEMTIINAVSEVGTCHGTHSQEIIDAIHRADPDLARVIKSYAAHGVGRLVFPERGDGVDPDKLTRLVSSDGLTIITTPGLQVPQPGTPRSEWQAHHHESVPILIGASRLASLSIWADRKPKGHFDDELGISGGSTVQGSFLTRLSADSRKFDCSGWIAAQTMTAFSQLPNAEIDSLFGVRFVGRSQGPTATAAAERLLTPAWVDAIPSLADGQFIVSGWTGKPRIVQADLSWRDPELVAALNTTPERTHRPVVESSWGAIR